MKATGTKYSDKFSGFLAVTPNKKFMGLFERADVHNILISYHYIRKNKSYTDEILDMIVDRGGLFMTDSGIFSFLNDPEFDHKTFNWHAYVEEYAEWLDQNKKRIFSALNMDADSFVVFDTIEKWNETYFEPLGKEINMVYGCHQNSLGKGVLDEVEYYSKKYDYIGVGEKFAKYAGEIYQKSKVNKCKVHGLAWTKPSILSDYPFFSVDSVTGDSLITIRYEQGFQFTTTIEDFYKAVSKHAVEEDNGQFYVDLIGVETLTLDNDNKIIWSELDKIMMHSVQKEMYKITLEGGIELDVTKDHSLIGMDKNGKTFSLAPEDLNTDSFLLYNRGYKNSNLGASNMVFSLDRKKYGSIGGDYTISLDKPFLNFLGLWLGDGSYGGETTIQLSCYNDTENQQIIDKIAERFDRKVTPKPNGVDCSISSAVLARYMRHIGLEGNSHTKKIPPLIFTLSEQQIGWFLQGYYSADGSGYDASLSTSSKELMRQTCDILTQIGIIFSTSHYKDKGGFRTEESELWTISICDTNSKKIFADKIGFLQDYKNSQLKSEIEEVEGNHQVWSKKLGVPKELSLNNRIKIGSSSGRPHHIKGWRINREQNRKFFSKKVIDSDVLFLKIVKIEKYIPEEEIQVYDLCVPETEKFLANNVVVHNSSSWVNYQKFGATIYFDGTNFEQYDNKRKDVRVTMKNKCREYGVGFDEFVKEKNPDGTHNDDEGLTFSIKTWLDVFEWIKKSAKPKLTTTVKDALKGKVTITKLMEDTNNSLASRLGGGITIADSAQQTYEVDEEGNKIAIYEKRNELVKIDQFSMEQGSLMVCSFCSIQDKCPKFKEGATCAFDFSSREDENQPLQLVDKLIAYQQERVSRAMFFEKMEGGVPSRVYTQELKTLNDLNMAKVNLMMIAQNKGIKLTQTSIEIGGGVDTGSDNANQSQGGGGFASLLANLMKPQ